MASPLVNQVSGGSVWLREQNRSARQCSQEHSIIHRPERAEQARQAVLEMGDDLRIEYQPGESEDYFMCTQLEIADRVSDIIEGKFWYLLESTSEFFVTSDHPVVLARPENYPAYLGVGFQSATVLLPLSPQRCLLLVNHPIPNWKFPGCLLLPFRQGSMPAFLAS